MPHEEGAPVWVRVGRTDHHARVVSAVVDGGVYGAEPSGYKVRWSNGTVQEVETSDVRPDEGGRGRTRRPPAVICQQETRRQMRCAGGTDGKSDRSPAAKKSKKAAEKSLRIDADDYFSNESDGLMKGRLQNARPVTKRSAEDCADTKTSRNGRAKKKTRKSVAAKHSIDEMRSAPAQKKTSMMIVELGDEHTKCIICYDKFSTDVKNDHDGIRRHLPVLSSSQKCDHW